MFSKQCVYTMHNVCLESEADSHEVGISDSGYEEEPEMSSQNYEEMSIIKSCFDHRFSLICEAIPLPTNSEVLQKCFARTIHTNVMTMQEAYSEATNHAEARPLMPSQHHFDSTYGFQETLGYSRPMFIYCHVVKPSKECLVGLHMKCDDEIVRISRVDRNGLLAGTKCLYPGDQIIAVNGCSLRKMNIKQITNFINNAAGSISFTVRNEFGDPNIILNSVQKNNEAAKLGIAFRNDWTDREKLIVSKIQEKSVLSSSLLCVGQQVLALQGVPCSNLLALDAAQLSVEHSNGNRFDIISTMKSANDVATVLSCERTRLYFKLSKLQRFWGFTSFPGDLQLHAKSMFTSASKKRIGLAVADSFDSMTNE